MATYYDVDELELTHTAALAGLRSHLHRGERLLAAPIDATSTPGGLAAHWLEQADNSRMKDSIRGYVQDVIDPLFEQSHDPFKIAAREGGPFSLSLLVRIDRP